MAKIMMKMQLQKMALTFLIEHGFGNLNMQIDTVFSSESTWVIGVAFGCIVKKLSAKVYLVQLSTLDCLYCS